MNNSVRPNFTGSAVDDVGESRCSFVVGSLGKWENQVD